MRLLLITFLSFVLLLTAAGPEQTSLILINGKIWTGNQRQPEAQAVALADNRIVAVGSSSEIKRLAISTTRIVDLGGKRVLPGFNDAHVHFYAGGLQLTGVQLRNAKSKDEFRNVLGVFAETFPAGRWITGGNWDHENWTPAQLPDHELIDAVTSKNPVFINRLDGHMALANAVALKLAGISRETKDVPGGVIVRDANGNPTGILKDAAQTLVERIIPAPTEQEIISALGAAQDYANSHGVTSIQDMSAAPNIFAAYQAMLHKGNLHVRVAGHQPLPQWRRLAAVGLRADFGNDRLHIGGLKGFADGSLGSGTALLFEPYADAPQTNGIPSAELSRPEEMWQNMEGADAAGLQIAVHAIGDKANHTILDMYERLAKLHGVRDRRLRIEHAQHLVAADIPRFGQLHVIASMQPLHLADDGRWAEKRIGAERAKTAYAFRSLLDSGAVLAFGSDWPVAPAEPLLGIQAAVTRQTTDGKHPNGWTPTQKINVAEAVRAYTAGSAYASYDEGEKGSLEPGKLADLVVLSDDIFAIDPAQISRTKVDLTIANGQIVFNREQPSKKLTSALQRH